MGTKPHADWVKADVFDRCTLPPDEGKLVWIYQPDIGIAGLGSWYAGRFDNWRGESAHSTTHWAPLVLPDIPYVP